MTEAFGNPSSAHRLGIEAARLLTQARRRLAKVIASEESEIIFTSGGTEANALAVVGAAAAARGLHIVLSAFEHPSVADSASDLEKRGFSVARVAPQKSGLLDTDALLSALREDTAVCALLWVHNELGVVQPVAQLASAIKARAPACHLHFDAVQALGKVAIDVSALGADSLSFSAHKIHGPKGAGALYLRKGARIEPRSFGGGQERGLRQGTEAVPSLAAFGLAVELAEAARPAAMQTIGELSSLLFSLLREALPDVVRHGDAAHLAPHILSLGFPHTAAEPLLHALEARGVFVSAGSACHARSRRPSATLQALAVPEHMATLRFSLSRLTTRAEVELAAKQVVAAKREIA